MAPLAGGARRLFRDHPQSPRPGYDALAYFPYEPSLRFLAEVDTRRARAARDRLERRRAGLVHEIRHGAVRRRELELYWLDAYGGGLFVPFRDATSGSETYGAGRYLLDTVKGADLGTVDGRLVLDFNFAYHPSCAYDPSGRARSRRPRTGCRVPIRAGERLVL